jgi:hypothetical protein
MIAINAKHAHTVEFHHVIELSASVQQDLNGTIRRNSVHVMMKE